MTYDLIVAKAATDLEMTLRSSYGGSGVSVFAVPTTADRDGFIAVTSGEAPCAGARCVRPCDNGASAHRSWGTVPYDALYGVLWHALRREPILPREGSGG